MTSKDKSDGLVLPLARRLSCRNARFDVYLDDVQLASGETVHDYLVVEPRVRTVERVTGVAVLPIVDGRAGLLRVYRHPMQEFSWELPRGFVDPGEPDTISALRELEEETGLLCVERDLHSLGYLAPEPGILAARVHLFAASCSALERSFTASEIGHQDFRFFSMDEFASLVADGLVQDPSTLVSYYRYRDLCGSNK